MTQAEPQSPKQMPDLTPAIDHRGETEREGEGEGEGEERREKREYRRDGEGREGK